MFTSLFLIEQASFIPKVCSLCIGRLIGQAVSEEAACAPHSKTAAHAIGISAATTVAEFRFEAKRLVVKRCCLY